MGFIKVKDVQNYNSKIEVKFEVSDNLKQYFSDNDNIFTCEYMSDISDVPPEVLVIPFITNVLPIAWVTDSVIIVDKLDKTFYDSINKFKQGFIDMYPKATFKGDIKVDEIIQANINSKKEVRHSLFFSGGVDSTSSLISTIHKKPILILIWGSDIMLHDKLGWETAKEIVDITARKLGLDTAYIKSNFRTIIKEDVLSEYIKDTVQDSWWHGIQHGIALLGHVAPYAYKMNIHTHYIPGTFCDKDTNIKCASYPTIDENLRFCNCSIIHEGFDKNRQQKVNNICQNYKKLVDKPELRVCYMSRGEKINCCECEKCFRTIYAIVAEKEDPRDYGFNITMKDLDFIYNKMMIENTKSEYFRKYRWGPIQESFLRDKKYWKKVKGVNWILKYDFDKVNSKLSIGLRIKNKLKRNKLLVKVYRKYFMKSN